MLSADLSVFDAILPTLDVRLKSIILFCVQTSPFFLTPVVMLNMGRLMKSWRRISPKVAVQEQISGEVYRKVNALLEVKKLSTAKTLIDYAAFLCLVFTIFVWIKSTNVGIAAVPAFDLCLVPLTLLWLGFAALFQGDFLPHTGETVTIVALSYNLLLLYNQVLIRLLNVEDRDTLLLVCRLAAGFIYCDHRKAAATQIVWILLKTQTPPHVADPKNGEIHEFWDVLVWGLFRQLVLIGPMWLFWFAVEYFVKQFTALMVQKSDMNASLVAARSVLASQCDAEAYLGSDLCFQNPSPKMAHFFGMKTQDLERKRLVDLLNEPDIQRFEKLVDNSVKQTQLGMGHQSATSLPLTFKHASGRLIETQIYLGSIPGIGDTDFCHLIALNEVRDSMFAPTPEMEVESSRESSQARTVTELSMASTKDTTHGLSNTREKNDRPPEQVPLNKDNLAIHLWNHSKPSCSSQAIQTVEALSVVFEPDTLEIKEIFMKFPTSNSKHRRKTLLSDCIIPAAWAELRQWLQAADSEQVTMPPVVPFVFPKFARAALAARNSEISQPPGSDKLVLTLSDFRLRRFQLAGSIGVPTMGRGTASHVSRCSFDDHKFL